MLATGNGKSTPTGPLAEVVHPFHEEYASAPSERPAVSSVVEMSTQEGAYGVVRHSAACSTDRKRPCHSEPLRSHMAQQHDHQAQQGGPHTSQLTNRLEFSSDITTLATTTISCPSFRPYMVLETRYSVTMMDVF